MKVLMVSSYLPYPLHSGGHVRLFNLIKELSGKHDITLVCEMRDNQSEDDIKNIEKICKKVITVKRRKQWTIENIFKSIISRYSFLVTGHTNPEMRMVIDEELKSDKYDLLHVETYYVMQNLPSTSVPLILVEHNIEYQVYQKYSNSVNALLRLFLQIDIKKIKNEEIKFWQRADKLIAVSENDAEIMALNGLKPLIVANGVDINKFEFKSKVKSQKSKVRKILFIGDFKWIQNRDSVRFIINDIWPIIQQKAKSKKLFVNLWIVGRNIPSELKNLTSDRDVLFDEKNSDRPTEELFQEADVLSAPIRVGGGTSYKILESMSCGTPVVTTELSANAIEATDEKNIMIGKSAPELSEKTLKLLLDDSKYNNIAANGRKLIEEKYTWKKIANNLANIYENIR